MLVPRITLAKTWQPGGPGREWSCITLSEWPLVACPIQRLTPTVRDRRAKYRQSLSVLEHVKKTHPHLVTKTSIMLGLGEEDDEVLQTMKGVAVRGGRGLCVHQ